jgi:hypothetical protein
MGIPPLDDDDVEPELLEVPPLDELLEEPPLPDELPLPEPLPLLEPPGGAAGAEPLEHPPARHRLAARMETFAAVGIIFELRIRMLFAPNRRGVSIEMALESVQVKVNRGQKPVLTLSAWSDWHDRKASSERGRVPVLCNTGT